MSNSIAEELEEVVGELDDVETDVRRRLNDASEKVESLTHKVQSSRLGYPWQDISEVVNVVANDVHVEFVCHAISAGAQTRIIAPVEMAPRNAYAFRHLDEAPTPEDVRNKL